MQPLSELRPGHSALRRHRVSLPGQVYLITVVTDARRPLFTDFENATSVACCVSERRLWRASKLLAWVLMPDHWHGLLQLGADETLGVCVGRMKAVTAGAVRVATPQPRRVWARAFHDHAIRREDALLPAARYLIANPVRAGLVRRVGDYPFWDAVWL